MIQIIESKFVKSAVKPDQYPATGYAEFAFVGKSNVGKSSLINTVLNRKTLAKVSSQPGKTRLINFFNIRFKAGQENGYFTLVDLPGYGYAKVSKSEREKWKSMITDYFQYRLQLIAVVVLVDIRHKADNKDLAVMQMLTDYQKNFCVIATKSDKIPKTQQLSRINKLRKEYIYLQDKIIPFSALKKRGINELLDWMENQLT